MVAATTSSMPFYGHTLKDYNVIYLSPCNYCKNNIYYIIIKRINKQGKHIDNE